MAFELSLKGWVGPGPAELEGKDLVRGGMMVGESAKL